MATQEDPVPLDKKSGNYTNCLPCSEAGRVTEAIRYCVECKSHLCEQCQQHHNMFAALRKHEIVDESKVASYLAETDQSEANTAIECGSHYGQYIDTFCKDHNEVCCSVCVTIKHRSCKQTEKILKIAEGIKESKEFNATKLSLEKLLVFANQEKVDRNKNLTSLDEETAQILSDIDKFEEKIIRRTREIAETSRKNIRGAYAKHVDAVKSDVKELNTIMSGLKESLNKLNKTNVNDVEAFVSTKNCQKTVAEVKVVMKDLSDKWLQTEIHYTFNNNLIHINNDLGDVIEEKKTDRVWRLASKRKASIRIKTDNSKCRINGICQLDDGAYVITDSGNANIKKLTDDLIVKDYVKFDDSPESICVTGPNEVAIALPEKNMIQFVTIDEKMSLGTSISTAPGRCTAINYDCKEEKLYVCCTYKTGDGDRKEGYGTISVFNKNGTLLTTFDRGSKGQTVLSQLEQIFIEPERILVLDNKKKLEIFKKTADGQLEHVTKGWSSALSNSKCLCLLSKKVMFCVSHYSYSRRDMCIQSMDGKITNSLQMEISSPVLAAVFDKLRSTLVVAGESNEITEYKVPLKILKLLK